MAFELMLRGRLAGETEEEQFQDLEYYLKKSRRFCRCCGRRLTAKDVMGSQGFHCVQCFKALAWDDSYPYYWCTIHDGKFPKDYRYLAIWPLFDPLWLLDDIEGAEA